MTYGDVSECNAASVVPISGIKRNVLKGAEFNKGP